MAGLLGSRLKDLRRKRDMTQEDLALKLHVNRATLANWEIGRNEPDHENLLKLADIFGVSVDYLLGQEEEIRMSELNDESHNQFVGLMITLLEDAKYVLDDLSAFINELRDIPFLDFDLKNRLLPYVNEKLSPLISRQRRIIEFFVLAWPTYELVFEDYADTFYEMLLDVVRRHFPSIEDKLVSTKTEFDKSTELIGSLGFAEGVSQIEKEKIAKLRSYRIKHPGLPTEDLNAPWQPFSIPPEFKNPISADHVSEPIAQYTPPPGLKLREQPRVSVLAQLTPPLQGLYCEMLAMPQSPFGGHRKTGKLTDEMVIELVKFYDEVRKNDAKLGRGPNRKPQNEADPEKEK